ncbi:MAG TPA: cyclophane-forming radical SAM/SPASM peptide maturase GrrM/OscB [Pirellulales bacterium]|jgi:uncharacterized protein|nr:cyclophane-forming radical SAM/SPASM peptide maturase GrrM/OscB [Pirellulales bacterium]
MDNGRTAKIHLVVIQPSPFCNIDCRYCYLSDRANRRVMDERTLEMIYRRLFASAHLGEEISILWHAGEPLTVPIAFYERAAAILARLNCNCIPVHQLFQTNATLITQAWCDFFMEHEAHISVSIDGPRRFHDANRVTRGGRGTFDRAMHGVKLLQDNGIPIHNIAVLTSESLNHPDELWEFFASQGFTRLGFNVEEAEGVHRQSSLRHASDVERYQAFFRRLGELRSSSGQDVWIRELDNMEDRIRSSPDELETTLNVPLATLNFDCDGNISCFSPELLTVRPARHADFRFGNVFSGGVDEILDGERFRAVHDEITRGVDKCRATCPYFSVCGGGEPSNKLAENGTFDSTETMHCRLVIQALCDLVLEGVEEATFA